jgi:hypothetical protein
MIRSNDRTHEAAEKEAPADEAGLMGYTTGQNER